MDYRTNVQSGVLESGKQADAHPVALADLPEVRGKIPARTALRSLGLWFGIRHLAARFSCRKATTLVMESLVASGFQDMWPLNPLAAGSK